MESKNYKKNEALPSRIVRRKFTVQDLSDETLKYIFSFLNFVQRIRAELVCKRWFRLATDPTVLRLDFSLLQNRKFTESSLHTVLARHGTTLKKLALTSNLELTGECLSRVGQYCPNLANVEMCLLGVSQVNCLQVLTIWPQMKEVKLTFDSKHFSAEYNEACRKGLLMIARMCKTLESLSLSSIPDIALDWLQLVNPNVRAYGLGNTRLTAELILGIVKRFRALTEFSVESCDVVDQDSLSKLMKHLSTNLTTFLLKNVDGFERDWLTSLPKLVNLQILKLNVYYLVDDKLMAVLTTNCVKIRVLDIGFSRVSDNGLIILSKLAGLKQLTIGNNRDIRGFGLEVLLRKGVLQHLTVEPINENLQQFCYTIAAKYPKVQFHVTREVENDFSECGKIIVDCEEELNAEWEEQEGEVVGGEDWAYWDEWIEVNNPP